MPQVTTLFIAEWAKESLAAKDLLIQLNHPFELIDIETEEGKAKSKTHSVSRLPSMLFLEDGKEVRSRIIGYNPQEIIAALQTPLELQPLSTEERLQSLINSHPLMLFIKGTPSEPRCGFTSQLFNLFKQHSITDFGFFNILSDDQVRQGLKEFSQWPTYPQIYVRGELVGGLDIIKEMLADGSFQVMLSQQQQ